MMSPMHTCVQEDSACILQSLRSRGTSNTSEPRGELGVEEILNRAGKMSLRYRGTSNSSEPTGELGVEVVMVRAGKAFLAETPPTQASLGWR